MKWKSGWDLENPQIPWTTEGQLWWIDLPGWRCKAERSVWIFFLILTKSLTFWRLEHYPIISQNESQVSKVALGFEVFTANQVDFVVQIILIFTGLLKIVGSFCRKIEISWAALQTLKKVEAYRHSIGVNCSHDWTIGDEWILKCFFFFNFNIKKYLINYVFHYASSTVKMFQLLFFVCLFVCFFFKGVLSEIFSTIKMNVRKFFLGKRCLFFTCGLFNSS